MVCFGKIGRTGKLLWWYRPRDDLIAGLMAIFYLRNKVYVPSGYISLEICIQEDFSV